MIGGAALLLASRTEAQQASRIYRIGLLRIGLPPPSFIEPFRQGLSDLGYVEGQNLVLEMGLAPSAEQLPEAATALVRRNVELLVASGAAAVLPARDAAGSIPVIFVAGIDPIATGLVGTGLTRPVGNFTGITTVQIDLTAKRMQLLKELLPSLSRIGFLSRAENPGSAEYVREAEQAARALEASLHVIPLRSPSAFEDAFREAVALGADALVPMDDAAFTSARETLVKLAVHHRLPGVYPIREFVIAGGLISLGPRYPEIYRRAASLVDRVLRGANPADIPIEQPTMFELVANLQAAKAFGIAIPPTLLARADEVIE